MRTLIVGVGALGGVIAGRLRGAGSPVWLATRDEASAARLRASGLRLGGVGGALSVDALQAAPLDDYAGQGKFELIVLATKAHDAIAAAPRLPALLETGGALLPIQNGGVAQLLADQLGGDAVLGGLSNLGATATAPGVFEQRNAGNLLIGELAGGRSERARRVQEWLGRAVEVRMTPNFRGAVWSKLLLNCSVTTIGAIAGSTLRQYLATEGGRALFDRAYREALSVALASGAAPERMLVEPVPPGFGDSSAPGEAYEAWLGQVLQSYGDLKASMLHDLERGRVTEVDFINGYVVKLGRQLGVATPANAAIVGAVHAITRGELAPGPSVLDRVLRAAAS